MNDEELLPEVAPIDCQVLLELSARAIAHGLREGKPLSVRTADYSANLRDSWPVKVALLGRDRRLGSANLFGHGRPLVNNVAGLVYAAAFLNRKAGRLQPADLPGLRVSITVLGPPMRLSMIRQSELAQLLQPMQDALVMVHAGLRKVAWPDQWQSHPDAEAFVAALKAKVGLGPEEWPVALQLERYCSTTIEGPVMLEPAPTRSGGADILGGSIF